MKLWKGTIAALGILALILDGQTALAGAQQGIALCLKTVIPSLFPFFTLSSILTSTLSGLQVPLLRPFGKLCKIPEGSESILLIGFLGGYPIGAQCVGSAYASGRLSYQDAARMLAFCNNAGPAFLFGMVASFFPSKWYAVTLWLIHIVSAICVCMITPAGAEKYKMKTETETSKDMSLPSALQNSLRIMGTVCGWVILFRILIAFANHWFLWILPVEIRVLFTGLLELSNGCWELRLIESIPIRFLIASAILAFGGLCVTMQTATVVGKLPLSVYLRGKLLQVLFSLVFSWGFLKRSWIFSFVLLITTMVLFYKLEKRSSNPALVRV